MTLVIGLMPKQGEIKSRRDLLKLRTGEADQVRCGLLGVLFVVVVLADKRSGKSPTGLVSVNDYYGYHK